jgi:hypothetical protein
MFFKQYIKTCFQIQIKPNSTSYICTSCLHNINETKHPLYEILIIIFRNKIIPFVQKLRQLEECLISSHFAFVQIYKLCRYGQYKMHGSVINVLTNMNQTQLILPRLPHNDITIHLCFLSGLEYKLFYMSKNVCKYGDGCFMILN